MVQSTRRVLLIEDDESDAFLVKHILTRLKVDFSVTVCECIESAIETLNYHELFDVILLDLGLPDGSGISNVDRISQHTQGAPILILSGWEEASLKELALGNSVHALSKSQLDLDHLENAISVAIAKGNSYSPLETTTDQAETSNEQGMLPMVIELRLAISELLIHAQETEFINGIRVVASLAQQIHAQALSGAPERPDCEQQNSTIK